MAQQINLTLTYNTGIALNINGPMSEATATLAQQLITSFRADQETPDAP